MGVLLTFRDRRKRLKAERGLYGVPDPLAASPFGLVRDLALFGRLGFYVWHSRRIQGWTRGNEAVEMARMSASLPGEPAIVEVGSFVGCSAVLLAGARRVKGSGRLHCVDQFVASGDEFSMPIYQKIAKSLPQTLKECFDANVRAASLTDWISVHVQSALDAATHWTTPIDMLVLDADHSPQGARDIFLAWERFLPPGGILAVSNSADLRAPGHDGSLRVVQEFLRPPAYTAVRLVDMTTFAVKSGRSAWEPA
jgi:hypothetical protein